jgi:hypothetical protein
VLHLPPGMRWGFAAAALIAVLGLAGSRLLAPGRTTGLVGAGAAR